MKEPGKTELSDWIGELGDGEYMLVAYKKDGMCWARRGEFKVTNRLRIELDQNSLEATCQHGHLLSDNTCGPCSKGRPMLKVQP